MKFRLLAIITVLLSGAPVSANPGYPMVSNVDTLACQIYRERSDWFTAAIEAERRWGLPVAHQLAFITEDWGLEDGNLPTKWRPDWTRPDRPTPGLPSGFYDQTWQQYVLQSGNASASPNAIEDVFGFMGWYFSSLAPYTGVSPYDPLAQHVLWRQGPDVFRAGNWQSNLWQRTQAERFASLTRLYMTDFENCDPPAKHGW